ncbi:MAG: hypothetical protein J5544_01250 [Clostridia bacterium]|nr:hypothetical protein [Clostridia bacterium]
MNGTEIFEKLNDLDPELIESEPKAKGQRHIGGRRIAWIAAAACLVFILGGTTAYAAQRFFNVKKYETPDENGYILNTEIMKIAESELCGEIREAKTIIPEQYKTFPIYSNISPDYFQRNFPDQRSAHAYVGYSKLREQRLPVESGDTNVIVMGSRDGEIETVQIQTNVYRDDVIVNAFAILVTEYSATEDYTIGTFWRNEDNPGMTAEFEEFTAADGSVCQVVRSVDDEGTAWTIAGYIVKDGVTYQLHIVPRSAEMRSNAMRFLHEWADAFAGK